MSTYFIHLTNSLYGIYVIVKYLYIINNRLHTKLKAILYVKLQSHCVYGLPNLTTWGAICMCLVVLVVHVDMGLESVEYM